MAQIQPVEILTHKGKKIILRAPVGSDAEDVLKYISEVLRESEFFLTSSEEMTLTVEQEKAWIEGLLEKPRSLAIIAEYENQVVGILHFDSGHRKRIAHTGEFGMSLDSRFRDEGLGTAILKTFLAWATITPGIEKIYLKVHITNERAIALYRKCGFIQEGYFKNDLKYGENQYADSIFMSKFVKTISEK